MSTTSQVHRSAIASIATALALPVLAQPGALDPGFTVGTGANERVMAIAQQPDGKSVIAGYFTNYRGTALNRIARVNLDGTVDAGLGIGTGFNSYVLGIALRSDGDIVAVGNFSLYDGTGRGRVARLNSDGTLDAGFTTGTGLNAVAFAVAVDDDKTYVGGAFTSYAGTGRSHIARLNDDGTLDTGFNPGTGFNGDVYCLAVQADGKVLVGGSFTSYDGTGRNGIARLNTDGTLDTGFDPGTGASSWVATITVQPDGRCVIGGNFTSYNGTGRNRVARLNSDGTLDTGFNPGTGCNSWVYCSDIQADGKVLLGGDFTSVAGSTRNRLARLNADGSLDTGFAPTGGANNWVYSMNAQPDGRLLIGGALSTYNGTARSKLAGVLLGCDNPVELELSTDGNGAETSWEIIPIGFSYAILSGSGYPDNATLTVSACLPTGCFRLRVLDAGGNGITGGGYVLRDTSGARIIDNTGNGGGFTTESALYSQQGFCLPNGTVDLTFRNCDKEDLLIGDAIECDPDPAVSAEWGVGDQTDDGYQFWFFDPNGSYSRRILRTHATSGGFGPAVATRACRLALASIVTNPLPLDLLLNVRVRTLVNGVYGPFGAACRLQVLSVPESCPDTKLIDAPYHPNYSCGVVRSFGASDKVHCYPLAGATHYRFRFERDGGGFVRQVVATSASLVLSWYTLPLVDGDTYNVTVQASFDGGSTYCPFGESCQVTIDNPPAAQPRAAEGDALAADDLRVWPQPLLDNTCWVQLPVTEQPLLDLEVLDLRGGVLLTQRIAHTTAPVAINLPDGLPAGVYLLRVGTSDRMWGRRLVKY